MSSHPQQSSWRDHAACQFAPNPSIFDAVDRSMGNPYSDPFIAEAVKYCQRCPVIEDCKIDALSDTYYPASGVRFGHYFSQKDAERVMANARQHFAYDPRLKREARAQ